MNINTYSNTQKDSKGHHHQHHHHHQQQQIGWQSSILFFATCKYLFAKMLRLRGSKCWVLNRCHPQSSAVVGRMGSIP
jgi:hypothetical protein